MKGDTWVSTTERSGVLGQIDLGRKAYPAARTGRAKCWRSGEKASAADAKRAGGV